MMNQSYSLSRKEGWRRWVDSDPRSRPETLTKKQIVALSDDAAEEYNDRRGDWHSNLGTFKTPQLVDVHEKLELIISGQRQDPDQVRSAAVLDALPGLGKTTTINAYIRDFDRNQRRRFGDFTEEGHEHWPIFRVTLRAKTTFRSLSERICEFYAHPGANRHATASRLATFAADCVLSCNTRIGFIDDLHFVDPRSRDGAELANYLKSLSNDLPITFIYAGVGLEERGIFSEGFLGQQKVLAQTGRRWKRLTLEPFTLENNKDRSAWTNLLKCVERELVLAEHRPGDLVSMADYLFIRTTGHMGSFMSLITLGCRLAIMRKCERLDDELLDSVPIDEAAHAAQADLEAKFRQGKLSTRITRESKK